MITPSQNKAASKKKSFLLYKDFNAQLQDLTVEQAGHLIKAVFAYQTGGEYLCTDPLVNFAFKGVLAQFKRDDDKYADICAKRSKSGANGAKQKLANAGKRKQAKQMLANQADRESDRESDTLFTTGAPAGDATNEEAWISHKKRRLTGKRLEAFKRLWESFGYKKGRAQAIDAFLDIPSLTNSLMDEICAGAQREAESRHNVIAKGGTPIFLQGWISGRRWEDDPFSSAAPKREAYRI